MATLNRRTLAVVFAGFCAFLGLYATQPILPLLAQVFHAGEAAVSLTVTFATAGVALSAPLVGWLADRLGRKRVIVASALCLALATAAAATARNIPELLVWRLIQGLATPGVFAVTVAYIQEEWAAGGAGSATAAYVSGTVLGGFTGRLTSGLAASHWGWRWSFALLGVMELCGAALLWLWLPPERSRTSHGGPSMAAALDHLANRRLLATYATGFCVLFSMIAAFTYVTFYLAAPPFHLSPAALGSIFFVYLIGAVITPVGGRAIDRFGHRAALAVAVSAGAAGMALTLVQSLTAVVAGLAICCTGVFIAQSAASSYIGIAATHSRALAVGLYATFYYTGGSAGAALPAAFWATGGWPACVALILAVQAVTILITLAWWEAPRVPVPPVARTLPSTYD